MAIRRRLPGREGVERKHSKGQEPRGERKYSPRKSSATSSGRFEERKGKSEGFSYRDKKTSNDKTGRPFEKGKGDRWKRNEERNSGKPSRGFRDKEKREGEDGKPSAPRKSFTKPSYGRTRGSEDRSTKRPSDRSSETERRSSEDKRPYRNSRSFSKPAFVRTRKRETEEGGPKRPFKGPHDGERRGSEDRKFSRTRTPFAKIFDRKVRVEKSETRDSSRPEKTYRKRSEGVSRDERKFTSGPSRFAKSGGQTRFRKDDKRGRKSSHTEGREEALKVDKNELIRLNRFISNAGISSRRDADNLIVAGLVSVNGQVITEMGFKVKSGDDVRYNGTRLTTEKKIYVMMNKPRDIITTLDDPEGRKIVTDLIKEQGMPRIYPVGRLDRNTTGVLLLTNDGEMARRLMHPKFGVQKIYKATLDKKFKGEDLWTLSNGVELEDGLMKPDSIAVPDSAAKDEVVVEIHSGKNRVIHRMFLHLGYSVEKLDRLWYAGLNKKSLKRGEWKHLSEQEIRSIKKLVKL